jgi:hypothetical protein
MPFILLLLVAVPAFSLAAPITFDFTGSVTSYSFNSSDPNDNSIAPNMTFSGTFTFDSLATNIGSGCGANTSPTCAVGWYASPPGQPYGMNLSVGGNVYQANLFAETVLVSDIPTPQGNLIDRIEMSAGNKLNFGGQVDSINMLLSLTNLSGQAFSNVTLPLTPLPLFNFDQRTFSAIFGEFQSPTTGTARMDGILTSLSIGSGPLTDTCINPAPYASCYNPPDPPTTSVPETSSLVLFGFGLVALARYGRKRTA